MEGAKKKKKLTRGRICLEESNECQHASRHSARFFLVAEALEDESCGCAEDESGGYTEDEYGDDIGREDEDTEV